MAVFRRKLSNPGGRLKSDRLLEIVHQVCREQYERGSPDFSYGTIGKLSGEIGGPQAQPIRNKTGEVYRRLIDIWARHAQGGTKKSVLSHPPTLMDELLMTITDGATRILVASIIRERKKLLYENQNLKKLVRDNFILDISDKSQCSGEEEIIGNQLHLLPVELDALNHAISPNLLDKMGWAMDERTGAVLNGPLPVFKAGFGTRVIALKCHLFALEAISAQFDMPLKFTTQENRSQSVTYASIL